MSTAENRIPFGNPGTFWFVVVLAGAAFGLLACALSSSDAPSRGDRHDGVPAPSRTPANDTPPKPADPPAPVPDSGSA